MRQHQRWVHLAEDILAEALGLPQDQEAPKDVALDEAHTPAEQVADDAWAFATFGKKGKKDKKKRASTFDLEEPAEESRETIVPMEEAPRMESSLPGRQRRCFGYPIH